jgi:hypothetical protein
MVDGSEVNLAPWSSLFGMSYACHADALAWDIVVSVIYVSDRGRPLRNQGT